MKVVALVSGGKDSCFNLMHCVLNGHEVVALGNLMPEQKDELDSYMFQTVGHDVIQLYGEALGLPLFRRTIKGESLCVDSNYEKKQGDEVEDLFELLCEIKEHVSFDAIATGAILSNYQRVRVENVCTRLGLHSLAYLWQRNQEELLNEMITSNLTAILIKVATLGLDKQHLGKTLQDMQEHLMKMKEKYGINVCGEGGEYETLTLDCPLFLKKIVIDESEIVTHSDDAFAPVGYLKFKKVHLQEKQSVDPCSTLKERLSSCYISKCNLFDEELDLPAISAFNSTQHDGNAIATEGQNLSISFSASDIVDGMCYCDNKQGKSWVLNVVCKIMDGKSIEESTAQTLDQWRDKIASNGYRMEDVCLVHLFCGCMDDFVKINSVYKKYFPANPPARVCVQAKLPEGEHFRLDSCLNDCSKNKREALYVQSISYWAPANIGPYSQAIKAVLFESAYDAFEDTGCKFWYPKGNCFVKS